MEPDVVALEESDAGRLVPEPGPGDDKFSVGVLGVLAGIGRIIRGRPSSASAARSGRVLDWSATPGRRRALLWLAGPR